MSDHSAIEWTEATWNPIVGCSIHSPGCKGCYAMAVAWRLMHNPNPKIAAKFAGTAAMTKAGPVFTGKINLDEEALLAPLRRKKPTVYFVNSLSDLFHVNVPDEWVDRIFAVMALCPQHKFQLLTKRADRMRAYVEEQRRGRPAPRVAQAALALWKEYLQESGGSGYLAIPGSAFDTPNLICWALPNVWLGVSVEDQKRANERIPDLLATPAAVRFLSCEPLLGPVDLTWIEFPNERGGLECYDALDLHGLPEDAPGCRALVDWVICGGESGPKARPMHPDWARSLRDQCTAAGVPFFFKQWGEFRPCTDAELKTACGATLVSGSPLDGQYVLRAGKKVAGRLLDGIEHNSMPGGR